MCRSKDDSGEELLNRRHTPLYFYASHTYILFYNLSFFYNTFMQDPPIFHNLSFFFFNNRIKSFGGF